jgi:hypothetical protein
LMPDINNAVALGVQPPRPQSTADIIAPINSLAQLQLVGANVNRANAETAGLEQTAAFSKARIDAVNAYNSLRSQNPNLSKAEALDKSGLAAVDPPGANAILGNETTSRVLKANEGFAAQHPNDPLAIAGPEYSGKELSNQKTIAETQKADIENRNAKAQQWGQLGLRMYKDPSPEAREETAVAARRFGIPEAEIQKYIHMPDAQYMQAGHMLLDASLNTDKWYELSGQAARNKGIAEAQTQREKLGSGETMSYGPLSYEATHPGASTPAAVPSSGVVGPSLGNYGPISAGGPSLAQPSPGAQPASALAQTAAPAGPNVRNVNAVSVPSLGASVPPEIAAAAKRNGVSENYLTRTAQIESNFNPNAYNAQSKAAGAFQFVPSTGAKYLNGGSPYNLANSADAAARLALDNSKALTQALGRPPTDAELYLAHQQGAAGAAKLLANPNARAGDLVGNSAIAANGGNPNAPASVFTNLWATKFNGGVGKSIPSSALAPNVTTTPQAAGPGLISGADAPLSSALQPAPAPVAQPAAPPLQKAPEAPATPVTPVATTPAAATVPNSSLAPTGTAADNTKPLLSSGYQPVDAGPSKAVLAEQEGQGAAYGKLPEELDKAATAAKTMNTTLDEMGTASEGWRMGKWATSQENAREGLQAIAKNLNDRGFKIDTSDLDKSIANYQDFAKLSGNILRQASHDTSSRVGVQEMQLISKSLPNPEMSEGGFKQIATQLKGINDFAIAKQQAAADWKATNNGSLGVNKPGGKDFQSTWNAQASPAAFVIHRMQQENPAGLQNLISTMSKTEEGKVALKNMRSQLQTANDNGWFGK